MKRLGIGMIGLGLAVKPHALALRELTDQVEFIGAFSPTAQRRREFETTYGLPTVSAMDVLLTDPRVDALIILTPPRTHAELALRAARAGKHVLLEKPIDVTLEEARAVVEGVEAAGRKLGVVFQHRFRNGAKTLRARLSERALGDLLSVSCSVRWWRGPDYYAQPGRGMLARDGGGVLLTQAIHTLDVMLDLAGPAKQVSAFCRTSVFRNMDTEDIACAAVEFRNGAVGVIDATTAAYPGYPEQIAIAGTRGSAVLEAESLTVNLMGEAPVKLEGSMAGGSGADPMAFSHEPHRRLIEDFVDAVRSDREPRSNGRSALAAHALIDAILLSSRKGERVEVEST
ncbi:MAG TPA: Gfo/Idh/MocA family oxidoreductase [Burkholderiales bacterium]|nr:Gfo/Idh/MocA family oxidoreductase [Burkholderiales bacterium]